MINHQRWPPRKESIEESSKAKLFTWLFTLHSIIANITLLTFLFSTEVENENFLSIWTRVFRLSKSLDVIFKENTLISINFICKSEENTIY